MNWRAKIAPFFLVAAIAANVTSCQDPKDIGLDLLDEQIGVHLTDTTTIEASVVLLDSVRTNNPIDILAGQYTDPLFGIVKTQPFFQLSKPGNAIKSNFDGATCDSVVMLLEYDYAYGDTLQDQKIEVHELTEELKDSSDYYSVDQLMFDAFSLGDVTFKGKNIDQGDTVRIKLDNSFGTKILNLPEADLASQTAFKKAIKGLTLTYAGGDAIAGFRRASLISSVIVYFTKADNTKSSATFFPGPGFNRIVSDRAGTPVSGLINTNDALSTEEPALNHRGFLEAGVGIRTVFTFPFLESLKTKLGTAAINKAEIILESTEPYNPLLPAPPALIVYESDGNNKILKNGEGFDVTVPNELALSNFYPLVDNTKYVIPLTSYVKALLKGNKENKGIVISATDNSIRLNRFVFGGPKHPNKTAKLRIYYTPVQ